MLLTIDFSYKWSVILQFYKKNTKTISKEKLLMTSTYGRSIIRKEVGIYCVSSGIFLGVDPEICVYTTQSRYETELPNYYTNINNMQLDPKLSHMMMMGINSPMPGLLSRPRIKCKPRFMSGIGTGRLTWTLVKSLTTGTRKWTNLKSADIRSVKPSEVGKSKMNLYRREI